MDCSDSEPVPPEWPSIFPAESFESTCLVPPFRKLNHSLYRLQCLFAFNVAYFDNDRLIIRTEFVETKKLKQVILLQLNNC